MAMIQTVQAIYDGAVLRPSQPLDLDANTRVRITVEVEGLAHDGPALGFLQAFRSADFDGPTDYARNVDKYLYGDRRADGA